MKRGDYVVSTEADDYGELFRVVQKGTEPNHYILRHVKSNLVDRSMEYYVGFGGTFRQANANEIAGRNEVTK